MLALTSRPALACARPLSSAASGAVSRPVARAAAVKGKSIAVARRRSAATAATKKDVVAETTPSTSSFEPLAFKASLAALAASPLAAHAEEAAAEATSKGGFSASPLEITIAVAPLLFYALLTLYRNTVNPKASIGDGLFIVAALVIVANIVSILVFKTRIY